MFDVVVWGLERYKRAQILQLRYIFSMYALIVPFILVNISPVILVFPHYSYIYSICTFYYLFTGMTLHLDNCSLDL